MYSSSKWHTRRRRKYTHTYIQHTMWHYICCIYTIPITYTGPLVLHPTENLVQLASWTTAIIFYVSLLGYLTFAPVVRRSSLPDCIFAGDRSALAVATQITAPLLHTRQPETPNEFVESVDQWICMDYINVCESTNTSSSSPPLDSLRYSMNV